MTTDSANDPSPLLSQHARSLDLDAAAVLHPFALIVMPPLLLLTTPTNEVKEETMPDVK
jgi:hypothetical protein